MIREVPEVIATTPGPKLRTLRERLQLTLRDVEALSYKIALEHEREEFSIPFSRLFGIEAKGVVPNIYRLYSLATIYRFDFHELLRWYGVDLVHIPADTRFCEVPETYKVEHRLSSQVVHIPVEVDPSCNLESTLNITMLVRKWGAVSFAYLESLSREKFVHAYVGSRDYTMAPLIPPGSFLQVDETRSKIENGNWRSEHERPIYFLETRQDGFRVGWCSLSGKQITVHPYPLSPTMIKSYLYPQDVDIVGQVVAVSVRLLDRAKPVVEADTRVQRGQVSNALPIHQKLGASAG